MFKYVYFIFNKMSSKFELRFPLPNSPKCNSITDKSSLSKTGLPDEPSTVEAVCKIRDPFHFIISPKEKDKSSPYGKCKTQIYF